MVLKRSSISQMMRQPSFWAVFVPVGALLFYINTSLLSRFQRVEKSVDDSKADFNEFIKRRKQIVDAHKSN